jgi:SAM-dependent methyltransferase
MRSRTRIGVLVGMCFAAIASALWWRKNPSPCPYSQRVWVELPRPVITRSRLREVLDPEPGERVLEVGPGTGYYSLPVARWLGSNGRLHILDIQSEMLAHTYKRANDTGIETIEPARGDAQALPYPDDSFDAAYLVLVLGEVPDQECTLAELTRVLEPGGRLIVGELFPDPHFVSLGALRERAGANGLRFERRAGGRLGYFATLRKPDE